MTIQTLRSELLQAVHRYYPVGCSNLGFDYCGYKLYREILDNKINNIIDGGNTPVIELVAELKKEFDFLLFDSSYEQFPSYKLMMVVEQKEFSGYRNEIAIHINISLLCKFYTIFIHDMVRLTPHQHQAVNPRMDTVYWNNERAAVLASQKERIHKMVSGMFPDHVFVAHSLLFGNMVTGCMPYYDWVSPFLERPYNLYNYLFDMDLELGKAWILD